MMEAVNWVCDDALDDHVWVLEHTISCQEAKVLEAHALSSGASRGSPLQQVSTLDI